MQQAETEAANEPVKFKLTGWAIAIAVIGLVLGTPLLFLALLGAQQLEIDEIDEIEWTRLTATTALLAALWASGIQVVCSIGLLLRQKWALIGLRLYGFTTVALLAVALIAISPSFIHQGAFGLVVAPLPGAAYYICVLHRPWRLVVLIGGITLGVQAYCIYLLHCSWYLRKLLRKGA